MNFKFVAVFLLSAVVSIQSAQLRCEFSISRYTGDYACEGRIITTQADYNVDSVVGTHANGYDNEKVTEMMLFNRGDSMEVLPKNLRNFFKNFRELGISSFDSLPNFSRGMFADYSYLTVFFAYNISRVTDIPFDTFYDMTHLNELVLDQMPNMRNLHVDLLVNAPKLHRFSAFGPNKIDQIYPGFFRNQMNSLTTVDFRYTNLKRISPIEFSVMKRLTEAKFLNAGCLDGFYGEDEMQNFFGDIRKRCQGDNNNDGNARNQNEIRKKSDDSSSTSTESK